MKLENELENWRDKMELKSALILVIFIILGVICFLWIWSVLETDFISRVKKSHRHFNEDADDSNNQS